MKRYSGPAALFAAAALLWPGSAFAKPPVMGGANQAAGVQVTYPHTAFNGSVRIKPKYFGPARAQDTITEQPVAGKKVMVFDAVISNGRTQPYLDDPSILLSDADGITADTRSIQPNGIILQQAAAARLYVVFWVADGFVPDHIVYTCQSARCRPIRIAFKH
ncbi:MAG: hypothetical protein ABR508_05565 [Candidatus Baltobacteraceae bacterium]